MGNLPDRVHHHKRVFRTAGYAMLGKVYWMMGRYEDALEPFGKAIETLRSTSADGIFLDYNSMVSDGRITYPTDDRLNPEQIYNIESMYLLYHAMYPTYYGSTLIYIKPEAMQRYYTDTDDLRLTFISGMESGVSPYGGTFDMNEKYHFEINRIVTNIGITSPDLYLMYAGCLARIGHESDAVALLEELRSRRLPSGQSAVPAECSSGDALVKFSLEERMRENLGYGLSWFDMRRLWNDPLFQDMKQMEVVRIGEKTTSDPSRNSFAMTSLLTTYMNYGGQTNLKAAYDYYKSVCKDPNNVSQVDNIYKSTSVLVKGAEAPEIEFTDADGKTYTLSDFKGKALYVDMWASWCGPCCEEIPYLAELYRELGPDSDIRCISISIDENRQDWVNKLAEENAEWPQFIVTAKGQEQVAGDYNIRSIPRFMLFDAGGRIVTVNAPRPSTPDIRTILEDLLK